MKNTSPAKETPVTDPTKKGTNEKEELPADWLNVSGTLPLKVKQKCTKVLVDSQVADLVQSVTSSKKKIVTVSYNKKTGKLTLKAKKKTGKSTITVTLTNGQQKTFTVKVQKKKVLKLKIQ